MSATAVQGARPTSSNELLPDFAPDVTFVLYQLEAARGALVARYAAGAAAARLIGITIGVDEGVTGRAAATWQQMINGDAELDLGRAAKNLRYAFAIPLVVSGVLVGVMTAYSCAPFSLERARHLEVIAPQLASSLTVSLQVDPAPARAPLRIVSSR